MRGIAHIIVTTVITSGGALFSSRCPLLHRNAKFCPFWAIFGYFVANLWHDMYRIGHTNLIWREWKLQENSIHLLLFHRTNIDINENFFFWFGQTINLSVASSSSPSSPSSSTSSSPRLCIDRVECVWGQMVRGGIVWTWPAIFAPH